MKRIRVAMVEGYGAVELWFTRNERPNGTSSMTLSPHEAVILGKQLQKLGIEAEKEHLEHKITHSGNERGTGR